MKWISAAIIATALLLSAALFNRLPDRMPIHWDASGQVNGYAGRMTGAFLMPAVMSGIALMFAFLPKISPRGYALDGSSRGYRAIVLVTMISLLVIHAVALLAASGKAINVSLVAPVVIGALFAVIGNYMTTMPRNFFVGIRTPWTLASEDVWFRTHRLGGRLFMAGGLIIMFLPLFGPRFLEPGLIGIIMTIALITIAYSYVVYRRIEER
jgi:uncharacterized membrane protein